MLASTLAPCARQAARQLAAAKPRLSARHADQLRRHVHSASVRAQMAAEPSASSAAAAAPQAPDGHSDWYYIGIASAVLLFLGGPAYVVHMLREDTESYQLVCARGARALSSGGPRFCAVQHASARCPHAQLSHASLCRNCLLASTAPCTRARACADCTSARPAPPASHPG